MQTLKEKIALQSNMLKQSILYKYAMTGMLPFSSLNEVQIHENELATSITFNMVFQHLLDNDKYLENLIFERMGVSDIDPYFTVCDGLSTIDTDEMSLLDQVILTNSRSSMTLGITADNQDAALFSMSQRKKPVDRIYTGTDGNDYVNNIPFEYWRDHAQNRIINAGGNVIYILNKGKAYLFTEVSDAGVSMDAYIRLPQLDASVSINSIVANEFKRSGYRVEETAVLPLRHMYGCDYFLATSNGLYALYSNLEDNPENQGKTEANKKYHAQISFNNMPSSGNYISAGFHVINSNPTFIIILDSGTTNSPSYRIFYISPTRFPSMYSDLIIREIGDVYLDGIPNDLNEMFGNIFSIIDCFNGVLLLGDTQFLEFTEFPNGFPINVRYFKTECSGTYQAPTVPNYAKLDNLITSNKQKLSFSCVQNLPQRDSFTNATGNLYRNLGNEEVYWRILNGELDGGIHRSVGDVVKYKTYDVSAWNPSLAIDDVLAASSNTLLYKVSKDRLDGLSANIVYDFQTGSCTRVVERGASITSFLKDIWSRISNLSLDSVASNLLGKFIPDNAYSQYQSRIFDGTNVSLVSSDRNRVSFKSALTTIIGNPNTFNLNVESSHTKNATQISTYGSLQFIDGNNNKGNLLSASNIYSLRTLANLINGKSYSTSSKFNIPAISTLYNASETDAQINNKVNSVCNTVLDSIKSNIQTKIDEYGLGDVITPDNVAIYPTIAWETGNYEANLIGHIQNLIFTGIKNRFQNIRTADVTVPYNSSIPSNVYFNDLCEALVSIPGIHALANAAMEINYKQIFDEFEFNIDDDATEQKKCDTNRINEWNSIKDYFPKFEPADTSDKVRYNARRDVCVGVLTYPFIAQHWYQSDKSIYAMDEGGADLDLNAGVPGKTTPTSEAITKSDVSRSRMWTWMTSVLTEWLNSDEAHQLSITCKDDNGNDKTYALKMRKIGDRYPKFAAGGNKQLHQVNYIHESRITGDNHPKEYDIGYNRKYSVQTTRRCPPISFVYKNPYIDYPSNSWMNNIPSWAGGGIKYYNEDDGSEYTDDLFSDDEDSADIMLIWFHRIKPWHIPTKYRSDRWQVGYEDDEEDQGNGWRKDIVVRNTKINAPYNYFRLLVAALCNGQEDYSDGRYSTNGVYAWKNSASGGSIYIPQMYTISSKPTTKKGIERLSKAFFEHVLSRCKAKVRALFAEYYYVLSMRCVKYMLGITAPGDPNDGLAYNTTCSDGNCWFGGNQYCNASGIELRLTTEGRMMQLDEEECERSGIGMQVTADDISNHYSNGTANSNNIVSPSKEALISILNLLKYDESKIYTIGNLDITKSRATSSTSDSVSFAIDADFTIDVVEQWATQEDEGYSASYWTNAAAAKKGHKPGDNIYLSHSFNATLSPFNVEVDLDIDSESRQYGIKDITVTSGNSVGITVYDNKRSLDATQLKTQLSAKSITDIIKIILKDDSSDEDENVSSYPTLDNTGNKLITYNASTYALGMLQNNKNIVKLKSIFVSSIAIRLKTTINTSIGEYSIVTPNDRGDGNWDVIGLGNILKSYMEMQYGSQPKTVNNLVEDMIDLINYDLKELGSKRPTLPQSITYDIPVTYTTKYDGTDPISTDAQKEALRQAMLSECRSVVLRALSAESKMDYKDLLKGQKLLEYLNLDSSVNTGNKMHEFLATKLLALINSHFSNGAHAKFSYLEEQFPDKLYHIVGNGEDYYFGVVGQNTMKITEFKLMNIIKDCSYDNEKVYDLIERMADSGALTINTLPAPISKYSMATSSAHEFVYWLQNPGHGLTNGIYPYVFISPESGILSVFMDRNGVEKRITNMVYISERSTALLTVEGSCDIYQFQLSSANLVDGFILYLKENLAEAVYQTLYSGNSAVVVDAMRLDDRECENVEQTLDSYNKLHRGELWDRNYRLMVVFKSNTPGVVNRNVEYFTFTSSFESSPACILTLSNVFNNINLTEAYHQFLGEKVTDIYSDESQTIIVSNNELTKFTLQADEVGGVESYSQQMPGLPSPTVPKLINTADPIYSTYYLDSDNVLTCISVPDTMEELYPLTKIRLSDYIPALNGRTNVPEIHDIDMQSWSTDRAFSYIVVYTNLGIYLIDTRLEANTLKYEKDDAIIQYFRNRVESLLSKHKAKKHSEDSILSRFMSSRKRISDYTIFDFIPTFTNHQYESVTVQHGILEDGSEHTKDNSVSVHTDVIGNGTVVALNLSNPGVVFAAVSSLITKYDDTWMKAQIADPIKNSEFYDYFYRSDESAIGVDVIQEVINLNRIPFIFRINSDSTWDMWINIPSTMTPYINRIEGSSANILGHKVRISPYDVTHRTNMGGKVVSCDVKASQTTVRVYIDMGYFNIGDIKQVVVSGSSLPMSVYRDSRINDGLYDGVALQTPWNGQMSKVKDGESTYMMVEFAVWGSDEQSVHLYGRTGSSKEG